MPPVLSSYTCKTSTYITQTSSVFDPGLTLNSDLLQLLQKVAMAEDSHKPVVCTHMQLAIKKHTNERLNTSLKQKRTDKRQSNDPAAGTGTSLPSLFHKTQQFASAGSSELIALKFTAFKAGERLIIWPTETPPVNYSSTENCTLY